MKKPNPDKRKKHIPLAYLSKLIVQAIHEEPFLNKDILIPKIKAILSGFHVNMNLIRFDEIREPTEVDILLKTLLIKGFDCNFYKHKLHDLVGDEKMMGYYSELEAGRPISEQKDKRSAANPMPKEPNDD